MNEMKTNLSLIRHSPLALILNPVLQTKLDALIQCPPLAFADSSHATFDVEMRFSVGQFFDGLEADGAVEVSMKLLVTVKMPTSACSYHTCSYIYTL